MVLIIALPGVQPHSPCECFLFSQSLNRSVTSIEIGPLNLLHGLMRCPRDHDLERVSRDADVEG